MQTFLPYPDFAASAQVLDYRRLGKQRVETKQILNALSGLSKGWVNHPASLMWRGHESALVEYGYAMTLEWRRRGYKDTMLPWFEERRCPVFVLPSWVGREDIHSSHRSNLLRKDPVFYGQFGWTESATLPYVWA